MSSSLSVGLAVYSRLSSDSAITSRVRKIFPVAADEAVLPYIAYRRAALESRAVKGGPPTSDAVRVEVAVCAATYTEAVELAELVRACIEGRQWDASGLHVRFCQLVDAGEEWQDDCFVENLVFSVKL